jgi:BASS family bile acid:Na+ symporter
VLASLFGHRFWITAYVAMGLGLWLPGDYSDWRWSMKYLLGGILYCSCLKVRWADVTAGLSHGHVWMRLGLLGAFKLLGLPLAAYALTLLIAPAWAPGVLLVGMMPAGLSSLAFADLLRGSHVMALFLILVTSVACPLTVPLLLNWLGPPGHAPGLREVAHESGYIVLLLLAPFVLAQLTRVAASAFVDRHHQYWGVGAIFFLCTLVFVAIAVNRSSWESWPATRLLLPLGLACLASAIFALGAWALRPVLDRGETIAFACAAVYMNNGLSMAFSSQFFPGSAEMVLPSVLMQVPMVAVVALMGWRARRAPNEARGEGRGARGEGITPRVISEAERGGK